MPTPKVFQQEIFTRICKYFGNYYIKTEYTVFDHFNLAFLKECEKTGEGFLYQ